MSIMSSSSGTVTPTELPLPTGYSEKRPRFSIRKHLSEPVEAANTWRLLLVCCFISGMTDASAFAAWRTFLDMQSGNTIFLALGASGQPTSAPHAWLKSIVSIAAFVLGSFFFSRFMWFVGGAYRTSGGAGSPAGPGPRVRSALVASFAIQAGFMFLGAGLIRGGIVPDGINTDGHVLTQRESGEPYLIELACIAFLAFQAAGQVIASRALGFVELPTTVLTTAYADLMGDNKLFQRSNPRRTRLALSIPCLLLGGIAGGWIGKSPISIAGTLFIAAALKILVCLGFFCWKKEQRQDEGESYPAGKQ